MSRHVVTACGCVRLPEALLLVGKDAWCERHELWSAVVRAASFTEITGLSRKVPPMELPF